MIMKALVTGASGFIGSRLVGRLLRDGNEVTCLVRRYDKMPVLKAIGAKQCIVADITDREKVMKVLYGIDVDVLFHLAALNPLIRDRRAQYDVNIRGLRNLIDAMATMRVGRVVYAQGMGVFGDIHGSVVDENSPYRPETWFTRLRSEAEKILWDASRDHGFSISIAILGDVYGNGGWFNNILVKGLIKGGRLGFVIPGTGDYYRCFIHVDDAVEALAMMAEVDRARNERFIVCDDEPCRFKDFVYYTADTLGVKRPSTIPLWLARLLLGSDMIDTLTASVKANNMKAKSVLNLRLRYPDYRVGVRSVINEIKIE
ncbi:MAG: NAD-dependent epimerase/dehydratase family protein [Candidatus Nitrosocaldus sp.]